MIVGIGDVTTLAHEIRNRVAASEIAAARAMLPVETALATFGLNGALPSSRLSSETARLLLTGQSAGQI